MEKIQLPVTGAIASVSESPNHNITRFLKIQAGRNGGALLMQAHSVTENNSSLNIARFLDIQASRAGGALLMQAHSAN